MLKAIGNLTLDRTRRLRAVIGALEAQRSHFVDLDAGADADTADYNRWIDMLEGVVEGNWATLKLPDEIIEARQHLMHLDAAVAFLKAELDG